MDNITRATLDHAKDLLAGRCRHQFSADRMKGPSARCIEIPWMADRIMAHDCRYILDIGFSMASIDCIGTLLELVKRYHRQLEAVDIIDPERVRDRYPSKWIPDIAAIPIHYGDIRHIQLPAETYDAVTCISTIEHVGFDQPSQGDPQSAFARTKNKALVQTERAAETDRMVLNKIHSALRGGGLLLLSVPMGPGRAAVVRDSLGYYCAQWEYEPKDWRSLVNHTGFSVIEQAYFMLTDENRWRQMQDPDVLAGLTASDTFSSGCALALMQKDDAQEALNTASLRTH